ncbi:GNAT family N-acetyltransferase [Paenibacillus sp. NPDC058174]|uniref:GNAT family N-acetyltransferase n=1 Tax=Paenibacillus sp. NPDC058174 TaxID=3346366 RepID=UPI0036D96CC8
MSLSNDSGSEHAIRIRDAAADDYESVIQVLLSAWAEYDSLHPDTSELLKQSLLLYAEPGPQERIVAELDGQIVGTAEVFHSSAGAYDGYNEAIAAPILRRLAVLPGWQRKGIATRLIQESANRALLAGASSLYLHTSAESNPSAVKLYERLGFIRSSDHDIRQGAYSIEGYRLDLSVSIEGGRSDES